MEQRQLAGLMPRRSQVRSLLPQFPISQKVRFKKYFRRII
uniref:Uncharacterized protein n=1 Tax=Siphoviridae sp. ctk4d14 TaxID=2825639 RepID=A0A8S5QJD6_9CAUD|nr:MAG TPA: hypothetical protein [Siphoviridae sp. ctk4d14]